MKIGELARKTGLPIATLRFYEMEGLIESKRTASSNYRDFPESSLERVRQLKNFRALNLSLPEMKLMLDWARRPQESCSETCELVQRHLQRVVEQREQLQELEVELTRLLSICSGQGPCSILKELS